MRKSRLSWYKQERLIEHFHSAVCGVVDWREKTTAAFYFHRLREIIAGESNERKDFGEFEVDESYFEGKRKGKRGRGAAGKVPVFGILKRGGRVYTQVIPNAQSKTLMPIIREKVQPDSIVYSDVLYSYNVLDVSEFKHFRINHSKLFADRLNHINGIENFGTRPSTT